MTCEQVDMLLAQSVFGELDESGDAAGGLREHLEGCPVCREKLSDMRVTVSLLTDAVQAPPVPKLDPVRKAAMLREVQRQTPRVLVLRIPVRWLAVAACVAGVALSAWVAVVAVREEPAMWGPVAMNGPDENDLGVRLHVEDVARRPLQKEEAMEQGGDEPLDRALHFYASSQPRGRWSGEREGAAALGRSGPDASGGRKLGKEFKSPAQPALTEAVTSEALAALKPTAERLADSAPRPAAAPAPAPSRAAAETARERSPTKDSFGLDADFQTRQRDVAGLKLKEQMQQTLPQSKLFRQVLTNRVVTTVEEPSNALGLVSDTASVQVVRQYFQAGFLPPPGAVRTEEFYNYEQLPVAVDGESRPVTLQAHAALGVFDDKTTLLKIDVTGVKPDDGREYLVPKVVATDAKLRVDFNPVRVGRYRLVGYEDHLLSDRRAEPGDGSGGELRDGQTLTALYEMELTETDGAANLGTVSLRYVDADTGEAKELMQELQSDIVSPGKLKKDPRFDLTASAARFAELLREGPTPDAGEMRKVQGVLEKVQAELPQEERVAELLEMVRAAQELPPAP